MSETSPLPLEPQPSGTAGTLVRGSAWLLGMRVLGIGLALVTRLILANLLGAQAFGDYVYVLGWMVLVSIVTKCGFDTAALRFVPRYRDPAEQPKLRGFLRRSTQVAGGAALAAASTGALALIVWRDALRPELFRTFLVACPLLVAVTLLEVIGYQLRGLLRVARAQGPQLLVRPMLLLAFAGLLWLAGQPFLTSAWGMGANLAGTLGALVLAVMLLRREIPRAENFGKDEYETGAWVRVAGALLLTSVSVQVLNRSDVLILGMLVGTTEAGIYSVAGEFSQLIEFGLTSINLMAAPMISGLYARRDMKELEKLIGLATAGALAVAIPAFLLLVFAGRWLLGWFGPEFPASYVPLVVLCSGQMVNVAAGPVGLLLTMTAHHRRAAAILGSAALLSVALNLLLIWLLGINGAAWATAAALAGWNIAMCVYVYRDLGLRPGVWAIVARLRERRER